MKNIITKETEFNDGEYIMKKRIQVEKKSIPSAFEFGNKIVIRETPLESRMFKRRSFCGISWYSPA